MSQEDFTSAVQRHMTGYDRHIGLEITEATPVRVCAELKIAECHTQIHGVVHGGVYTSIVETLGSIGAALSARAFGRTIVGLDNHTSFLKAIREGTLHAVSEPITAGRRTQIWTTQISDDAGTLLAFGQLRLLCIEAGTLPHAAADDPASPFTLEGKNH
jgi:1,4-dihydroxy-2-naphthoyl-CoA hydrolase